MHEDWPAVLKHMQKSAPLLQKSNPGIMEAFQKVREANHSNDVIDTKTRELIAIGVAAALHCDGCIASHVYQAKRAGATAEEVGAAIGTAMAIGMGSQYVQALNVLDAYDQF